MMHFVSTFSIMRAYGVRLTVIEEARSSGEIVFMKTFSKMTGGRMHTFHSTPPGSALGHKLQTPSKESGIY